MRTLVSTVLSMVLLGAAPAGANLIVNGSFETPAVSVGGRANYTAGSTAITGWTVVGVDVDIISGSFMQSGVTWQAQHGIQWADLSGFQSNSMSNGLRQDVATTIGQLYELTFYVGSAFASPLFFPATVDLSINGGARTQYHNPSMPTTMLDWDQFTVQFVATAAITSLTFLNGSASNNFATALDNVSLVAVTGSAAEPATLLLLAAGMAGLMGLRRQSGSAGVTGH